jgi:hypothetical protein
MSARSARADSAVTGIRTSIGVSTIRVSGSVAPTAKAQRRGDRRLERPSQYAVLQAKLVADMATERVDRCQLLGDRRGQLPIQPPPYVHLGQLGLLELRVGG